MTKIPFLSFPWLAMKNILQFMDFIELLRLSSCNRRLRCVVQKMEQILLFYRQPHHVKSAMNALEVLELFQIHQLSDFTKFLQFNKFKTNILVSNNGDRLGIEITLKDDILVRKWFFKTEGEKALKNYLDRRVIRKFEDQYVTTALMNCETLCIFGRSRWEAAETLVSWFRKTFGVRFETLKIHSGAESRELRAVINAAKGALDNCEIYEPIDVEDLNFIFENVHVKNEFYHYGVRTEPVNLSVMHHAKAVMIDNSKWFTIENLTFTNCAFINLIDSSLTNEEVERFLILWKNDVFPNLRHFSVQNYRLSNERVLRAIGAKAYRKNIVYNTINHNQVRIYAGANIVTNARLSMATILLPKSLTYHLRSFEMVVWPDFNGIPYHVGEI